MHISNSKITLTTLCVVLNKSENKILLINREKNWKGYAAPGGHVNPDEGIVDCAIREVMEETGLVVSELQYKGLYQWIDKKSNERYMVFNYYTENYSGELCNATSEGNPEWMPMDSIGNINLAEGFEERLKKVIFNKELTEMTEICYKDGHREKTYVEI